MKLAQADEGMETKVTMLNDFLEQMIGNGEPTLLDLHKAFSVTATLYIEDSLNLVTEAAAGAATQDQVLLRADALFEAWEIEMSSLKSAILASQRRNS